MKKLNIITATIISLSILCSGFIDNNLPLEGEAQPHPLDIAGPLPMPVLWKLKNTIMRLIN